jgi:hypothetical protein
MANQHDIQLKSLDKKITDLKDALSRLGKGTDLKDLLRIIRKPGPYTTPAEMAFSHALVDSLAAQVSGLANTQAALLNAAKQVGAE